MTDGKRDQLLQVAEDRLEDICNMVDSIADRRRKRPSFMKTTARFMIDSEFGRWEMAYDVDDPEEEQNLLSPNTPDPFPAGGAPFEFHARQLKQRERRRRYLLFMAHKLATAMADRLDDLDGWSGEERRDKVERATDWKRP